MKYLSCTTPSMLTASGVVAGRILSGPTPTLSSVTAWGNVDKDLEGNVQDELLFVDISVHHGRPILNI